MDMVDFAVIKLEHAGEVVQKIGEERLTPQA
jgi:hypothetical protein